MGRNHPFRGRCRRAATPAAAVVLLAALCAGTAPDRHLPASVRQDFDTATVEKLDAALEKIMKDADIPGLNVGLWIPGRGVYEKSFGVADKKTLTPMKTDLHTRIGSVTKPFTVTAVLQLVDQGKVGLDDPISRYVTGVPGGDALTVRQLADMRSGLFDYTQDQKFLAGLRDHPHRAYTPRQMLDMTFGHPPTWAPALVDGRLLTEKTQAERLRTLPTGLPGISNGLGILDTNGWLGHNGEIPGYESITAQLPAERASLVVLVTSDVDHDGKNLPSPVGNAVTSIVTPDHLWPAPGAHPP
ncbi:serine hydrolase domain-containing protein [Streptomyces sp. 147326]|uniref:serine hydrolase domain-containing protein n=1 Tax=Streptomyces sp. 147326 TaxID=3074379 RepID=UPI0038572B1F